MNHKNKLLKEHNESQKQLAEMKSEKNKLLKDFLEFRSEVNEIKDRFVLLRDLKVSPDEFLLNLGIQPRQLDPPVGPSPQDD